MANRTAQKAISWDAIHFGHSDLEVAGDINAKAMECHAFGETDLVHRRSMKRASRTFWLATQEGLTTHEFKVSPERTPLRGEIGDGAHVHGTFLGPDGIVHS